MCKVGVHGRSVEVLENRDTAENVRSKDCHIEHETVKEFPKIELPTVSGKAGNQEKHFNAMSVNYCR